MDKGKIYLGIRIALSFGLITFFLLKVDLYSLSEHLQEIRLSFLFMAVLTSLFAWVVNTCKWQRLLSALKIDISFKKLLSLNFIALFYNLFLPGQIAGEIIKGFKINHSHHGAHKVFISIVADRISGFLALFIMGFTAIIIIERSLYLMLVMILLVLSLAALPKILNFAKKSLASILQSWGEKQFFKKHFFPIFESIRTYGKDKNCLIISLFYSFLFQGLCSLSAYWICLGLGIRISFIVLVWVMAIVFFIQAMPISISGIGVREGALILLLSQYGIASSKALAFSLTLFAISILMSLAGGVIDIFKIRVT
ncbi:MAG: flippase-like domain-containing protein [Candidatus Omnitrophica bacterium]|nr:flippase-like domain-containing protein [Candidatus Omnitrophota bacterium]MBU1628177.1 flippase-like domain-containing protein [bacterium]